MVASHHGGSESLVVVATLLFLTTSTSAICPHRFADVPAGSDVTNFQCPMCTLHRSNPNYWEIEVLIRAGLVWIFNFGSIRFGFQSQVLGFGFFDFGIRTPP